MLKFITLFFYTLSLIFVSCGAEAGEEIKKFMPDNTLHLEDSIYDSNITKSRADSIFRYIEYVYDPIFKKNGLSLTIINDWNNSTVNAVAYQRGSSAYVQMYGGLIRRWEITEDGMALIACHEIGHHLGGFPIYSNSWASAEGNSDYFATQLCAKEIFKGAGKPNNVRCPDPYVQSMCEASYRSYEDIGICCRTAHGTKSVIRLLGRNGGQSFGTPSNRVVNYTRTSHPEAQCRMDTMFQGSLCPVENYDDKIPWSEKQMRLKSCTRKHNFKRGNRPLCWFRPSRY